MMMDRETLEITLAIAASALLILSEGLALSKNSKCNSVSEFLANTAKFIGKHMQNPEQEQEDTLPR